MIKFFKEPTLEQKQLILLKEAKARLLEDELALIRQEARVNALKAQINYLLIRIAPVAVVDKCYKTSPPVAATLKGKE